MRSPRTVAVALVAVTALTFVPVAEAFPVIRIRLPRIEVPTSAVRPLTEEQWVTQAGTYQRRLAEVGESDIALGAQETLLQLRYQRALQDLDACLTDAAGSVVDGTAQTYVESGQYLDVDGVVAAMIDGCIDQYVPGYVPAEGREVVVDALAAQVVEGVGGVDASTSSEVDVPIDWSQVSYTTGTGTSPTTSYAPPTTGGSDDSSSPLVPALVALGGIGVLLLIVRALRRRT